MGVPLLEGRGFRAADREGAAPVAIVNAAFAQKYLRGRSLGRRITISNPPVTREIVGVVATVRHGSPRSDPEPETYVPAAQDPAPRLMLAARVSGDAAALTEVLGRAVREIDPDLALYSVRTMEDRMSQSLTVDMLTTAVMTLFAAIALLLAALGLHAVLAWNVLQRMHELGVRAAFGARRHDLVMLVLRDVVKLMALGSVVGLAALGLASNSVGRVLFDTSPHDLQVLAGAVIVLAIVAVAACVRPALRAGRADPLVMLRQ
jgi:predicted lysophospholipase L1 biosynthesis ABC-type transport system permease subunit